MRRKKTEEEIQEAKILGRALATLRVARGMAQGQVAERAGIAVSCLSKAECGKSHPGQVVIRRVLTAMDVTFAALHRAEELVQDPMGERNEPIDAPDFRPEEARQAALRLAQEAGRSVAHCCLAFMELQAGGWPQAPR